MRMLLFPCHFFVSCFLVLAILINGQTYAFAEEATPAEEKPEKEIFIHIHSGIKTMPIRKVLGIMVEQAEKKGVKEILGNGKHVEWDVWDVTFALVKEKETKEYKWRYGREAWNLQPMNENASEISFPLDRYVMGPAINMGLGMIEEEGIKPDEIIGRGEKLPDEQWWFALRALDPEQGVHIQSWLYNPKSGEILPQHFDHSDLDKVLATCLTDNGINYSPLKKNADLDEFLKKASWVAKNELAAFPQEEQTAFWINLHNAIVLKRVADKYPVKSIKDIKGLFDRETFKVAGEKLTLNDIRNRLISKNPQENMALLALFTAAKSSPPLRKEPYCGRFLQKQLEENLSTFLLNPANLYATEAGILASPVLEPLEKEGVLRDFLKSIGSLLPENLLKGLEDSQKEIKFTEYDWGLYGS